ncbi:hypothetical protein ILUMI_12202 [Ignelater luminosus]|uniref:Transposase n=1 Tax=Ignelater luminosus TaxID=2038154 RepID=A0A8K0G701_IGNLU|nr:hypothetical protein ILUMI_12202 [Ignelater luminosus]
MLLVFEYSQGRSRCSTRQIPNFATVNRRLCKRDRSVPVTTDYDRKHMIRTPVVEEILERVAEDPTLSTRRLGSEVRVSKDVIHKVIKEQLLHPYHIKTLHDLLPPDSDQRLSFCLFINAQRAQNMNLGKKILFTD